MQNNTTTQSGSVVIYIVLLMFVMMTSAAIVLSTILSKHIRASENYLSSEQSFAAANSSIEDMLYQLAKGGATGTVTSEGTIEYENGITVDFKGKGCAKTEGNSTGVHLSASGSYKTLVRRIELSGGADDC